MDEKKLPGLPVGLFDFADLRTRNMLYVDKTDLLMSLADGAGRYFLSRPRRFGKSLTLSTLEAMFLGRAELFEGLAAQTWVKRQRAHPNPVLRLDIGNRSTESPEAFERSLVNMLRMAGSAWNIAPAQGESSGDLLERLVAAMCAASGPVVILVDEYDKPVLDNLGDLALAEAMRRRLRAFYTVIKGCEPYLRFVMLTGISKFTKMGVFSAINNLSDISMDEKYGALCGYTQEELERLFDGWIERLAARDRLPKAALLDKIREYYDGFCFDGVSKVYNPFSTLQLFDKGKFRNYWYESASPSFIATYLKDHGALSTEEFRHVRVGVLQIGAQEIERAEPASFLLQSGYLTIEKMEDDMLTLDYPNKEVRTAVSAMFLYHSCGLKTYAAIGSDMWKALASGDMEQSRGLFNAALAGIPYDVWNKLPKLNEALFQSYFIMLLEGAGLQVAGEVESRGGRSDVEVRQPGRVTVIEFKAAHDARQVETKRREAEAQIAAKGYAAKYAADSRPLTTAAFVVDLEKREVF